jgi:pantoate--beta-alanine ligase
MAYLMLIFRKISELQGYLSQIKSQNKTIGFVPTMGALHNGHLSLIKASKDQCDYTVCSVFVNPTQFNDKSDLDRYPRMPEKDAQLLESAYCDALFLPPVEEIYSGNEKAVFDFGYLDKVLEGEHRPGHFNGVAQVVKRLFEIVMPDKAFMGSKDYQQVLIVKALVKQMGSDIEVISCPILREPDGLAMSSRNALLSPEERKTAGKVPQIMEQAKRIALDKGIEASKTYVKNETASVPGMKLDYYEICDTDTLKAVSDLPPGKKAISLIALFVGKIRLIDNLILN